MQEGMTETDTLHTDMLHLTFTAFRALFDQLLRFRGDDFYNTAKM